MVRDLKFFYLGYQCPHNAYLLARIKTIAWKESVQLDIRDISRDEKTCEEYRIFSPTLLIVNDDYRWNGPFSKEDVLAMLYDEDVPSRIYDVPQAGSVSEGETVPLDRDSVLSTCGPCLNSDDVGLCRGKAEWVGDVMEETGAPHLGRLHFVDGVCVGGAEYLPSEAVPYPIPDKRKGNAFLTCSYLSEEDTDVKALPLMALIEDLRGFGYDTLSVASAVKGVFPNGPAGWFERMGFVDRGLLAKEEFPVSEIRYMQLDLRSRDGTQKCEI